LSLIDDFADVMVFTHTLQYNTNTISLNAYKSFCRQQHLRSR